MIYTKSFKNNLISSSAFNLMKKYNFTFIDLFAGIGGIRLGFEEFGGKCVFSSEWDPYAQKTYEINFGERPKGDITKIHVKDIPDHDILLAGFPCQSFSIIGEGKGFSDTRGTMFFEVERILKARKPMAFLLENVRGLVSHDKKRTFKTILKHLDDLGYFVHWKILNTLDFGLPQKRERTYIVGFDKNLDFNFPTTGLDEPKTLEDILEPEEEIDKKWFSSDYIIEKRKDSVVDKELPYPSIWHENKSGNVSPLPYSCALRASASFNYLLVNGERRLTPREQLRLQGFPEDFLIVGTETKIRMQTGNSVSIPVIKSVAKNMLDVMFPSEDY